MILAAGALSSMLILETSESASELTAKPDDSARVDAGRTSVCYRWTATALFHGDRGLIDGNVIDANGRPVGGATVWAEPLAGRCLHPFLSPY